MTPSKRFVHTLIASVFIPCFFNHATAQQLVCEKLQQIVNVVATDSTLNALKGPETENKIDKTKQFMALVMLWDKESEMEGQYINYDKDRQRYIYHAYTVTEGTPGKEEAKETIKIFRNCLGNDWLSKADVNGQGDSVYYLKNPVNFVVIEIWGSEGNVSIDFYNDSKKGDECVLGDCDSYFGTKKYFSEDMYSGTFIDGIINGVGVIKFYTNGTSYSGSFIDNQLAGYGAAYNEKNQLIQSGVYFKGELVTVDTAKKTCQYGDCQTGFGLKVMAGSFYIGNFKDGYCEGLGELITGKTAFYGYFQKSNANGKCIMIDATGAYTFATCVNGKIDGIYEKDFTDKTSKRGNAADGTAILYDQDNFFSKAGVWSGAVLAEYTYAWYVTQKAFVASIKGFYSYRSTGFKEIRGEQGRLMKEMGFEGGYKSKLLFLNEMETSIAADNKHHYYVDIDLTGKTQDKTIWIGLYNKYYKLLNRAVGVRWTAITDDGIANAKTTKASFILQNIFDRSKVINLCIDERRGVQMEIH